MSTAEYSKRFRFTENNVHTLQRVMEGMDKRRKALMPEIDKKTTQTDAVFAALVTFERLLIQEGYLQEKK